jgi:hypothetical protein
MASKYSSLTPYNFSFNDPVTFADPSGADPADYYFYGGYFTYDDWIPQRDMGWQTSLDRSGAGKREFGQSLSSFGGGGWSLSWGGISIDYNVLPDGVYNFNFGANGELSSFGAYDFHYVNTPYGSSYHFENRNPNGGSIDFSVGFGATSYRNVIVNTLNTPYEQSKLTGSNWTAINQQGMLGISLELQVRYGNMGLDNLVIVGHGNSQELTFGGDIFDGSSVLSIYDIEYRTSDGDLQSFNSILNKVNSNGNVVFAFCSAGITLGPKLTGLVRSDLNIYLNRDLTNPKVDSSTGNIYIPFGEGLSHSPKNGWMNVNSTLIHRNIIINSNGSIRPIR